MKHSEPDLVTIHKRMGKIYIFGPLGTDLKTARVPVSATGFAPIFGQFLKKMQSWMGHTTNAKQDGFHYICKDKTLIVKVSLLPIEK